MPGSVETFTSIESPVTSRADFQRVCASLLQPLVPCFSPQHSVINVGATGTRFDETAAGIEGFARPMWGLAPLLAGRGKFDDAWRWTDGLKNGTNPDSSEFWGFMRNIDQRMVESNCIGFALAIAGDTFWKPLSDQEKHNVGAWLRSMNDREMPNTNWLWFRVFANLGLAKNGAEYDAARLESDLNHLDTFYRGDGWSNDGPEGYTQMDSYSGSYAIQFLQLLYAKINGDKDPERANKFRERAKIFALDAVHYYDPEGRIITFGRSLTYRFAMAGFWSAVAFADLELPAPLTWGVVKGLLLRNCRWWMNQKDILDAKGALSIGYCYPNQFISENYNSPGSPYWFMLSFVALACPDEHPFWTATEEPHPMAALPVIKPLKQPHHIMVRSGGHTFLLSSGQMCHYPMRAGAAKYGKFAYSSAFGYSVPTGEYGIESMGSDNVLALSDDMVEGTFGERWKVRRVCTYARIEKFDSVPVLVSGWQPWHDVSVDTWLIPPGAENPNWHVRVHRVKTGRKLRAVEGAWAMYGCRARDGREIDAFGSELSDEGRHNDKGEACAASVSGAVGIADLQGSHRREGKVIDADANTNLIHNRTIMPSLFGDLDAGQEVWYVSAVFAVPESAADWKKWWSSSWKKRPSVPKWVQDMSA